jgi:hypothetical protein
MTAKPNTYVDEKQLEACLIRLRDFRAWAVINKIDPWAVRQALVMTLEIDTKATLDRGIKPEVLKNFDNLVKVDTQKWAMNE